MPLKSSKNPRRAFQERTACLFLINQFKPTMTKQKKWNEQHRPNSSRLLQASLQRSAFTISACASSNANSANSSSRAASATICRWTGHLSHSLTRLARKRMSARPLAAENNPASSLTSLIEETYKKSSVTNVHSNKLRHKNAATRNAR